MSVKCNKDIITLSKRTNGIVKAMGVVGEAQLWEPEESFLLNGILNLRKVPNKDIPQEETTDVPKESPKVEKPQTPDIKVEVTKSPDPIPELQEVNDDPNTFEFEIKKKCQPPGNNDGSVPSTSFQIPSSPKHGNSSPASTSTIISQNQKARLHQPWLSPQGSSEETGEIITPRRERTESFNSWITGESSNPDSIGCREENESTLEPTSEKNSLENPEISSPNSKHFSDFISMKPQAEFRQPSGAHALIK